MDPDENFLKQRNQRKLFADPEIDFTVKDQRHVFDIEDHLKLLHALNFEEDNEIFRLDIFQEK